MARNSRNSNWSSGGPVTSRPAGNTGFEKELRRLGLNERTCAASRELKAWCERNKDRCYIPEWLLKEWGMSADSDLSP